MTLKMSATTSTTRKTSRLLPHSLGLAVTIVIVIAAIYGLLLVALSTVANAIGDPNERSIDDPTQRTIGDPSIRSTSNSHLLVLGR
jgi:predicted alpha/beta hydrolase family esterase